jgi:hypothetical protein
MEQRHIVALLLVADRMHVTFYLGAAMRPELEDDPLLRFEQFAQTFGEHNIKVRATTQPASAEWRSLRARITTPSSPTHRGRLSMVPPRYACAGIVVLSLTMPKSSAAG